MFDKLGLNQKYLILRRAIIFYFAKGYVQEIDGLENEDFEDVMSFVKKCYEAYYEKLENTQSEVIL